MTKISFFSLLLVSLSLTQPALAQRTSPTPTTGVSEQIAAVVNESVISASDVRGRMALALFSSNMPNTPEIRAKLFPQVLRNLIDEQLQLQEGKRLDLSVSVEEINRALEKMAQQNNIPGGDMDAFLLKNGVPPSTLRNQARATLTWNKIVMRELRPRIDVGDDEVQTAIDRIKANAGKQESLVSEIFIAVDNPKDDAQVKNFAEQLVQQIRNGGNFGAIARQFSQGTGAANGGDIGWIQDGQLSPELNKALMSAHSGEITFPIRTSNGYHILGIRDQRMVASVDMKEATLNLQQVFMPFAGGEKKDEVLQEAARIRSTANGCSNLADLTKKDFPRWHWMDLGDVKPDKAPSWIVDRTSKLAVGQSSEPMATDKGALILFLCRKDGTPNIDRNEILNTIGTERLELLARRQQRDMRRAAYLDFRMNTVP